MAILDTLGTFVANLLSKGSLPPGGAGPFGEFDAKNFVESNLSQFEKTKGTNIKDVTQGIGSLFGLGKIPEKPLLPDPNDPTSTKAKPTGNLDYLGSVLNALGSNQGQQ